MEELKQKGAEAGEASRQQQSELASKNAELAQLKKKIRRLEAGTSAPSGSSQNFDPRLS